MFLSKINAVIASGLRPYISIGPGLSWRNIICIEKYMNTLTSFSAQSLEQWEYLHEAHCLFWGSLFREYIYGCQIYFLNWKNGKK